MKFDVKNTTLVNILDLICPHSCRGCGHLGAVICECCKNDITMRGGRICPLCRRALDEKLEKCPDCETELRGIYVAGWREGALSKLIKDFKYRSVRACGDALVEMLDRVIPQGVAEMTVVPLPTIGRHVRERGLDHTLVMAKKLAKRRGWRCERILERKADFVQVGTKATERQEQAEKSYMVAKAIDANKSYLLLDDVWTTGMTIRAAEKVLREAGAKDVYAALVAVGRPQEKSPEKPEVER